MDNLILLFETYAPVVSVAVCLLTVAGIVLARRSPDVREAISLVGAVLNFGVVVWTYVYFQNGTVISCSLVEIVPGVEIAFRVDELGLIFALVASSLWIVNTLYSIGYMRAHNEHKQTRFYCCFAIAIASVMGAAFSANAFSMFAFYEILTICTYPLVIHAETDEARAGAKRYIAYLLGSSIAFQLPALFLLWHVAGTFDFMPGGLLAETGASWGVLSLMFVLFIAGMAKCGIMPLHSWLPAAMVAPTPVSALLHAVAVVKMGVFGVSRVVLHVFGTDLLTEIGIHHVLLYGACFTIVCASLVALAQDNLKRRLAYSTISQLSYILLGVALLSGMGQTGGLVHLGAHAVAKITLFFAAGAIYVAHHKTLVSQLDGIARRMPITMTAFAIGVLSMIGLPPAAGLVSKGYLAWGAVDADELWVLGILFTSALLNAAYFLPILWRAFFRPLPDPEKSGFKEAPWPCVAALSATALGTVLLFFFPGFLVDLAEGAAGVLGRIR